MKLTSSERARQLESLLTDSLLPSTMALLGMSRKPLSVKGLRFIESRGLTIHRIGSRMCVITRAKSFLFIILTRDAVKLVPWWEPDDLVGFGARI